MFDFDLKKYTTLKGWEVPIHESNFSPTGDNRWSNKDMDPVPKEERVWGTIDFCNYWLCDAYGPGTLQLAGSMIASGMSWKMALGAIALGNIMISWFCTLNGTVGATLHTSFAVTSRSSFGFWGSYFPVVSRLVLAIVWFGVNTYTGSQGMYLVLRAMWPSIANIPNTLPESAGITTRGMLCYILYWLLQTPLMMLSPKNLRYLFAFKSIIGPIGGFAMMGWYAHKSGGALYGGAASLNGSALAYVFLASVNSAVGSYSTLSVNIADFTRYAKGPRSQYIQIVMIPVFFIVGCMMGIVIASGAQAVNGGAVEFNPLVVMQGWENRSALFFGGFSMMMSSLGSNISSNSLSAANDWCVLFPKYLNIRRGSFLVGLIGPWAMAPWKILASAGSFLSFMGGYVIFMAPICGIMVADYFFIKKTHVDVPALYDPKGRYRYGKYGTNWRSMVTLLVSVGPVFPGFLNSINPSITLSMGMQHFYTVAWIFGTVTSLTVYTALSLIWPPTETFVEYSIYDHEVPVGEKTVPGSDADSVKEPEMSTRVVEV